MTKSFSRHSRREFLHKSHHFHRDRLLWKAILLNSHPLCTTVVTGNILTSPSIFLDKSSRAIEQKHRHIVLFPIGSFSSLSLKKCSKEKLTKGSKNHYDLQQMYVQKEHTNRHSSQIKILLPHHRLISAWNIQLASVMYAIAPLRAIYMTVLVLLLFFFGLLIPHETSGFQPVLNESWLCVHTHRLREIRTNFRSCY